MTASKSESLSPVKAGKRKRPVYADSSSEDDAPLASSSPVKSRSAAVSMPGAVDATTLPASKNGKGTDSDADSYEDVKSKKKGVNGKGPAKKKVKKENDFGSDSEDEQPIKKRKKAAAKKKVKEESEDEADSEDNIPIKKRAKKKGSVKNGKVKKEEDDVAMDETPKKKKGVKKDVDATPKKVKGKTKEEEDEEVYRWWEAQNAEGDGSEKWRTLEHHGVIFPPPYDPLPKNVKMRYNGGLRSITCADTGLTPMFHRAGYRPSASL